MNKHYLKKFTKIILSTSLIISLFYGYFLSKNNLYSVQAVADSSVYFNPSTLSVDTGSNFTINAMVNPGSHLISVAELYVTYNQAVLQLNSITLGPVFAQSLSGPTIPNNGTAYLAAGTAFGSSINAPTTIATFSFSALATTTNSPISFTPSSIIAGVDEPGVNQLGSRVPASITVVSAGVDVTAPSKPASLSASAISSSQINLSWAASTDNVGVVGYKIYRNSSHIATTSSLTFSHTGLSASTLYSYQVSAYDALYNESILSTSSSATTQATSNSGSGGGSGGSSGGGGSSVVNNPTVTGTSTIASTTSGTSSSTTSQANNTASATNQTNTTPKITTDSDGDELSDALEKALGTNPFKKDSDGDGYDDKIEIMGGYNPSGTGKIPTDKTFSAKQAGKILLQVEDNGEAWYINPLNMSRYYLGRPADAFAIMRRLGLGAKHSVIQQYAKTTYPKRLAGRILLDVEDSGKAYYINPKDLKAYYLGRPADAFEVMRKLGIGIKNLDLKKIAIEF